MKKENLMDYSIEELEEFFLVKGYKTFRAKQVFQWIQKGIHSMNEMTNLSKDSREELKKDFHTGILKIFKKMVSSDGTRKYLMSLTDDNIIESVLMEYKHGYSACISSQIGCRMGCKLCASTGIGFKRNLTAGEMTGQIVTMKKDLGKRIGNIVIMGIGEPLDNYGNVVKFLRMVNNSQGLNIGYRHISVSTCGLVPQILKLSKETMPVTLSVSLHAPNDILRNQIVPVNKKYSIDKIIQACMIYRRETGRRITFEYAMINGLNDSRNEAKELALLLKNVFCHVNLIPFNAIKNSDYVKSTTKNINQFRDILVKNGIETTIRRELGEDIEAACGQLRRSTVYE